MSRPFPVLASGSATVVHDGTAYLVDRPGVVPFDTVASHFTDERSIRLFGATQPCAFAP